MICQDVLKTKVQSKRSRPLTLKICEDKRRKRINEAINWEKGTINNPSKHVITKLANGMLVYFLKPGKEANNVRRPNPHDMTPVVGSPNIRLKFDDIWSSLSRISMIDLDVFKAVLTLIYRNAYLIDYVEVEDGIIRYQPNDDVLDCIEKMENKIGDIAPFGLIGLLHFLDILGWNEDVKYHTEKDRPTFSGRYGWKVGRINTLLTCIRVPYQAALFVKHVIDKVDTKKEIDFQLLFTIMQQFANSRGTCTPTQNNLTTWLAPYILK